MARKFLRRSLGGDKVVFEPAERSEDNGSATVTTDGIATIGGQECHYIMDDGCDTSAVGRRFAQQLQHSGLITIVDKDEPVEATLADFSTAIVSKCFEAPTIELRTDAGDVALNAGMVDVMPMTTQPKYYWLGENNAKNWVLSQ